MWEEIRGRPTRQASNDVRKVKEQEAAKSVQHEQDADGGNGGGAVREAPAQDA